MFDKFIKPVFSSDKTKVHEAHGFTKGVHSIICLPLETGFNLNLQPIVEGKEDAYWSKITRNEDALFFNTYGEFKAYFSSKDWQQSWRANLRCAVFFLGYTQQQASSLFKQNKFSELVVRASHLHNFLDMNSLQEILTPRFVENTKYNSFLHIA
jgi:hypothetical protein